MAGRFDRLRRSLGGGTTLIGTIDAMGKEREEQILERMGVFVEQVVVMVRKLQDVVERFAADDYSELENAAKDLDRLESEADDVKQSLLDRLYLGGVFPLGRVDLARLISSMDQIANLAAGAADRILMRRLSLPDRVKQLLVQMAAVDTEAVEVLRDSVFAMEHSLRDAITTANRVDKIESRADDIFAEIYRDMFDTIDDFKTFHQLKAILERLEAIADRASQNAELVRHMALEYIDKE